MNWSLLKTTDASQEQAAAKPVASATVAQDILKSPRGPVTEQTVAQLREDGFSGDVVEIAQELAND